MVQRKDRRHPRPKIIAARTIAGIPKLGHEPVPALRDVLVIDADLGWAQRESIAGQGGHDHVEVLKHRQHVHVVEETARPAVREDEGHASAGRGTLVYEVDAFPCEMVKGVELALPSTPVELIGPVGHEALQPDQLGALFPSYAGYLVGPSRMAQPCPQIVKHLICDMNPKRFHCNNSLLAMASVQPNARVFAPNHLRPDSFNLATTKGLSL